MTTSIYQNGAWREVKTASVYNNGAWRSVKTLSVRDTFNGTPNWRDASPTVAKPASAVRVTVNPDTIQTLGETCVFTIQLVDEDGNAVSESRAISVTRTANGLGTFTTSPTTTNATGTATIDFTTNSNGDSGTAGISVASSGLTSGSKDVTVALRAGITPTLGSNTAQTYGFTFPHTNVNSLYTYTTSSINTTNALLLINTSYSDNPVSIFIKCASSAAPTTSQAIYNSNNTSGFVDCTRGTWGGGAALGSVVTIRATRTGYTTGSANSSAGFPSLGFSLYWRFQWQYQDGNIFAPWVNWGDPIVGNVSTGVTGRRVKGSLYNSNIRGKLLRCLVYVSRNYGTTASPNLTGEELYITPTFTGN